MHSGALSLPSPPLALSPVSQAPVSQQKRLLNKLRTLSFRNSKQKTEAPELVEAEGDGDADADGKKTKKKKGKGAKAKPTHVLSVYVSSLSALKGVKKGQKVRLSLKIGGLAERSEIEYQPTGACRAWGVPCKVVLRCPLHAFVSWGKRVLVRPVNPRAWRLLALCRACVPPLVRCSCRAPVSVHVRAD